jgi:hypothetical protein
VSFATITLCISSQRVFIVVYFVINSVQKLLDTPAYVKGRSYHRSMYICMCGGVGGKIGGSILGFIVSVYGISQYEVA